VCLNKRQLDVLPGINTEFIFRFRQMILKDDKLANISNEDHIQMLKFMRKRDAEGAERLVRDHILRGQDEVLREFGQTGAGKRR
jgi:DNA-binding GntR family transcriptional regulator